MKTVTLKVDGLLGVMSGQGIEKQLRRAVGVSEAHVNAVNGSTTLRYDEKRTDAAQLARVIQACGHHCRGESVPEHLCADDMPAAHEHSDRHAEHTPAAKGDADDGMHRHGGDMQAMVRDMRNRFLVCLFFSVPIFMAAPMGLDIPTLKPPFGMDLNLFMFLLASAAILWPTWPFVTDAVNARYASQIGV